MAVFLAVLVIPVPGKTHKPFDVTSLPKERLEKQVSWQESENIAYILENPEVTTILQKIAVTSPKAKKVKRMQEKGKVTEWITAGSALARVMGMKARKRRQVELQQPVGKVIASALASFAKRGQPILDIKQNSNGCSIKTYIFQDISTGGATLEVTIQRIGGGLTQVETLAVAPGAAMDWGKMKRAIDKLFAHLKDPHFFSELANQSL